MNLGHRARFGLAGTLLAGFVLGGGAFAQTGDASGVWLTEGGESKIRLSKCGAGYCGTIISTSGSGIDTNNPDPAKRSRSLVGVQIVNASSAGSSAYEGTLYNPKDGKTYSGTLKVKGPGTVEVAGCVMGVFCKSQTWRKVN